MAEPSEDFGRIADYLKQHADEFSIPVGNDTPKVMLLGTGKFNKAYIVEYGTKKFVLRINMYIPHEKTSKIKREYMLLRSIGGTGIGPKAYFLDDRRSFFDGSAALIEYIPGKEFEPKSATDSILKRIAKRYAELHSITFDKYGDYPPSKDPPFRLCGELDRYYRLHDLAPLMQDEAARPVLKEFGARISDVFDILRKHEDKFARLESFSLLKGDNKPSNIIVDGELVRFIDWEFGKVGLNIMDIANFLSFVGLNTQQREVFLSEYGKEYGSSVSEEDLRIFLLRDAALRSIWTLNKVSEHQLQNDSSGLSTSLAKLSKKTEEMATLSKD